MRKLSVVPAFLAACLVAAVSLAAGNNKVVAEFVSQASSGVGGQATLSALPHGGTLIHGKIQGLQPNVEYVSQYFTDGACTAMPGSQVARFRANPQGGAEFTARIDKDISDLKSISVQLGSDLSLKACASVTP